MNLEMYKDDNLLIVTPSTTKIEILKKNSNLFINAKYMSLEEYKNHYYFSYDNSALDYLMTKYQIHLDFANIIMSNLYVIDLNKEYKASKLKYLQEIKQDLINNHYLKFDLLFSNYLKDKKIIVYDYPILEKYEEEMFKNAIKIEYQNHKITSCVYHCFTLEDEVLFVIEKIIDLLKKGISPNKIVISNVSSDYLYTIYQLFSYYHIPINIDMEQSIYGTNICKNYLKNKTIPGFTNQVVKELIDVINSLVELEDSLNYREFLIDALKTKKLPITKYKNAITIRKDIPILDDDMYLFIVGFNQDILPKIHKDEDYISDSIKDEVLLYTTAQKNNQEKNYFLKILSNNKNIFLSYKDKSSFNEYLKSSLIDDLGLKEIDYISTITNSHKYNKLLLGQSLDSYYKYKEVSPILEPLMNNYQIPYNTYSNKFNKIDISELYNMLNSSLNVSYTSLNSYYLCKFQYYIKYILKIDPYESNFSTVIGNLFHYIFSVMDLPFFKFDREWNSFLEKQNLSIKEKYLLDNLKEDLLADIKIIKDQDLLTNLKNKKTEEEINISFDKPIYTVLTGKIDKILYEEKNNQTLISIIDYKTGNIVTNINNLKYGLSMQLPIYLYLTFKSNLFKNPKFVGIYLQKVLTSKYNYETNKSKDKIQQENLKLQGYSTSNLELLSYFDKTYENSELIKAMKLKKDGSFSSYAKILNDQEFIQIINYTETKINEAIDHILEGDFSIDPKVIDNKNISCNYCKYKDICFRANQDLRYLEKVDDLSFLGGNLNEVDN